MNKDTSHVQELEIASLSRIHFEGGSLLRTSRANPARSAETLRNVADSLEQLGASYLLTIGGDDTASGAAAVARVLGGKLKVAHVPKTIDNDLPLPPGVPTFGYTTAVDVGKDLVRNLMKGRSDDGQVVLRHDHGAPRRSSRARNRQRLGRDVDHHRRGVPPGTGQPRPDR
jgi:6-phosphofructokinase 1